jgi:hypothetical protein
MDFFWRHTPLKMVVICVMPTPASENALPDMGELQQ